MTSKPTQRALFYFISPLLNTSARKSQCRQHGVSSLSLSQHSGDPACSHHLWAQDSSHQCQTAWQPVAISAGQGTLQSPWHLPHLSQKEICSRGCCEDLNADVEKKILSLQNHTNTINSTFPAKPVRKAPAYPKPGLKEFLMSKPDNSHLFKKIQS